MIEVEGPDGTIYEFPEGTDEATMRQAMAKVYGAPQQDRGFWQALGDNVIGFDDGVQSYGESLGQGINNAGSQMLSGANEGVAATLGAPVDLMTSLLNLGSTGINAATGASIPQITDPVGGGGDMQSLMSPFIGPKDDSLPGRYARSIGREIGAAAIPAGAFAAKAASPAAGLLGALQSSVGAGTGAQVARDVAPGNPLLEMIGALAGGSIPALLQRSAAPRAPTSQELGDEAKDLYQTGRQRAPAPAEEVQSLKASIMGEMQANSRITPTGRVMADGNVRKFLDVLDDYDGKSMSPGEIQNLRTYLQDAAASVDAGERRLGAILLGKFDDWRGQIVPEFSQADSLYSRMKRAEDVDLRVQKAERRAATSGTGGNTVNATRQNIRQILDNPTARRGYSPAEIAAMEEIVRGNATTNSLRLIGRLSPTSGALPLMGNIAGVGISPAVGVPIMGAAAGAKGLSEVLTNRQISSLSEMIRNGGPLAARQTNDMQRGLLAALLGITGSRAAPQ
jgi:hypothetical protein